MGAAFRSGPCKAGTGTQQAGGEPGWGRTGACRALAASKLSSGQRDTEIKPTNFFFPVFREADEFMTE